MRRDTARSRTVLALLLTAGAALLLVDARAADNPVGTASREAAAAVTAPLTALVGAVATPLADTAAALAAAPSAADRVAELERRNSALTARVEELEHQLADSARLAELRALPGLDDHRIVAARAVTRVTGHGYPDTATLDVGARDGVAEDQAVVNEDGLVGRVTRVTARTSTVTLVTDATFAVGARLRSSAEIGVVSGAGAALTGGAPLVLELLDATAPVREGEGVVTLGAHGDAPVPPGVPVGTVAEVLATPGEPGRTARLAPSADLSRIDLVGVVVAAPQRAPRPPLPPAAADGEER